MLLDMNMIMYDYNMHTQTHITVMLTYVTVVNGFRIYKISHKFSINRSKFTKNYFAFLYFFLRLYLSLRSEALAGALINMINSKI